MNLNELASAGYRILLSRGVAKHGATTVADFIDKLYEETSETEEALLELIAGIRKSVDNLDDAYCTRLKFTEDLIGELVDVIMVACSCIGYIGGDADAVAEAKLEYNKTRKDWDKYNGYNECDKNS